MLLNSRIKNTQILKMQNQLELINSLNRSFNISNEESNKTTAEKIGYQNSSNETIYKGSKIITPDQTIDEIWKNNNLDFTAKKSELFYKDQNGELKEVKDYQAIINNNTGQLLNIPKNEYSILQLETIKRVIKSVSEKITIESVMNIDSKRFVINTYINDCIGDVLKDDPIKRRMTYITSMDSSVGFTLALLDFRMFCFNQMAQVKQSENVSFKHTKSITGLVERLPQIIDFNKHQFNQDIQEWKYMAQKEITLEQANETLKELFSNEWKNKIVVTDRKLKLTRPKNYLDLVQTEKIKNNFLNEINMNGSTAYSLNNAISYYYSHQAGSKNIKSESEKARIRTENNLYGKANAILNKSKELCLAI
tara:strand:+ start:34 stop:1128 length:1095 start_codon:yes stop_codon:yes gene_type:complete